VRVEGAAAAHDPVYDPPTTPFGPWRAVGWEVRPDEASESDETEVAQSAWTSAGVAPSASRGSSRRVPGRLRGLGGRFGWGLADQAVSSLTNFAVSLYVARTLGAVQFGAFSLAYVTYSFILNASRGLATDPLTVRFSGVATPAWKKAVAASTGTASSVGLIAAVGMLTAGFLLTGTARSAFIAMGLTMPGLMLQDSWRYAFFAHGKGHHAFLNDLIWALAMAPALIALKVTGHETIFWFVLAWGTSANVAAAAGPIQARIIPALTQTRTWITTHKDLALRYLAENTIFSGSAQVRLTFIGIIAGLAAVGYVQSAQLVLGPFVAALMGISLVTVPEAARVLKHSPKHLRLFCVLVAAVLAVAGAIWGVTAHFVLPLGIGQLALKSLWRPTNELILPVTVAVMGTCVTVGASAGLRALGSSRRSLRAMIISSTVTVVASVLGALQGHAVGTVRGTAIAGAIAAVVWWWQLKAALRESPATKEAAEARADKSAGRHRAPEPARAKRGQLATPDQEDQPMLGPLAGLDDQPAQRPADRIGAGPDGRLAPRPVDRPVADQGGRSGASAEFQPPVRRADRFGMDQDGRSMPRPDGRPGPRREVQPAQRPADRLGAGPEGRPVPRPVDQPAARLDGPSAPLQNGRPGSRSDGQPVPRPVDRPAAGPEDWPAHWPAPRPLDRPALGQDGRPGSRSDGQPVPRPADRPAAGPEDWPAHRPAPRPLGPSAPGQEGRQAPRPLDRPALRSDGQPAGRPVDRPAVRPEDWPAHRSASRPLDRPPPGQEGRQAPRPQDRPAAREDGWPPHRPASQPPDRPAPRPPDRPAPRSPDRPAPRPQDRPAAREDGRPPARYDDRPAPRQDGQRTPRPQDSPAPRRDGWLPPRPPDRPAAQPQDRTAPRPAGRQEPGQNGRLEQREDRQPEPDPQDRPAPDDRPEPRQSVATQAAQSQPPEQLWPDEWRS
jgi:O-antigen/teichoic acid export membrane protein